MARKKAEIIGVLDITAALDRLSVAQLKNLKNHKYSSKGTTFLTPMLGITDKNFLILESIK